MSFTVGGAEGYMHAGSYPDDGLGEVFLKLGKQGSTLAGVMDAFSMAISVGLQYGIPLESYVSKFTNMRFEPAGMTDDPDVRIATSGDGLHLPPAGPGLPALRRARRAGHLLRRRAHRPGRRRGPAVTGRRTCDPEALPSPLRSSSRCTTPATVTTATRARRSARAGHPSPQRRASSTELIESPPGPAADAPLCLTCGTKMRPAGSCYVCEGCGSTSGCS